MKETIKDTKSEASRQSLLERFIRTITTNNIFNDIKRVRQESSKEPRVGIRVAVSLILATMIAADVLNDSQIIQRILGHSGDNPQLKPQQAHPEYQQPLSAGDFLWVARKRWKDPIGQQGISFEKAMGERGLSVLLLQYADPLPHRGRISSEEAYERGLPASDPSLYDRLGIPLEISRINTEDPVEWDFEVHNISTETGQVMEKYGGIIRWAPINGSNKTIGEIGDNLHNTTYEIAEGERYLIDIRYIRLWANGRSFIESQNMLPKRYSDGVEIYYPTLDK